MQFGRQSPPSALPAVTSFDGFPVLGVCFLPFTATRKVVSSKASALDVACTMLDKFLSLSAYNRSISRRESLVALLWGAAGFPACARTKPHENSSTMPAVAFDSANAIERLAPLAFPYETRDPFLFCVHHDDLYPAGNAELGPKASLGGRNLGQDFTLKDGFRMYHGTKVPGFPCHPHRGFETVTWVRNGYVDHSDSMGAAGRYGQGDVQWMTAGRGVQHSEMFPLLDSVNANRTELFQIWLNLPARSKMVAPHFKMLWSEQVPRKTIRDVQGRGTVITVVAGNFAGLQPPVPPPDSWASVANSDVAILTLHMAPNATFSLPPAKPGTNRTLYFFSGSTLWIGSHAIRPSQLIEVKPDVPLSLRAGNDPVELLLLQGKPIGEPVVQHGPFVMNSREEIVQTIHEYQQTEFGGWPWSSADNVHSPKRSRFARYANGTEEAPT